jgi:hypothetical protein
MVNQKLGTAQPPAPKPAEPPPPRSSTPIGAEFASTSGDNFLGGFSQPASNENSDFEQPATGSFDWFTGNTSEPASPPPPQDFFGSPTSVDWGASASTPAHGSGKDVPQPSDQEYDSWMKNLPIDKPKSDESFSTSFAVDSSTPFGDTSFMTGSDDFGTSAPADPFADLPTANPSDPFGRSAFGVESSPWDAPAAESKPKPATPPPSRPASSPFGDSFESSSSAFGSAFEDDPFAQTGSSSSTFGGAPFADDTEEEGELDFDFDAPDADDSAASSVFGKTKRGTGVKADEYFQYIPAEIEAKAGGMSIRSLAMLGGIAAMLVVNLISLVMLFSAL